MEIPVVVQHRHVHVSEADAILLFGDANLERVKPIDQKNQFVSSRLVSVHGPAGSFSDVAVLGPVREHTQVELSSSDAFAIGVQAPLRLSGDLDRSATVVLKVGEIEIEAKMSTIIPIRHLHLPPDLAEQAGLAHHDVVCVKTRSEVSFNHVVVRIHPSFTPAFHLTKDEASPYWIHTGDQVIL